LGFRDRHFESKAHGYHVAEAVRWQVHFEQGNLLAPGFQPEAEIYDVIFCRNLLIYFDRATQDRAIKVLERLLTKGFLFVGPSETGLLLSHDFVSAKVSLAFAFRWAWCATLWASCTKPSTITARRFILIRTITRPLPTSRFCSTGKATVQARKCCGAVHNDGRRRRARA
jgi:hypothetical protein